MVAGRGGGLLLNLKIDDEVYYLRREKQVSLQRHDSATTLPTGLRKTAHDRKNNLEKMELITLENSLKLQ